MSNFSIRYREKQQAQTIVTSRLLSPLVASAVLFAFLMLLCAILSFWDPGTGHFQNLKFSSGSNLDVIKDKTRNMTEIRSLSEISKKAGDKYIRVSFEIPSSGVKRTLRIYTYFSQAIISINYKDINDTIHLSDIFSENGIESIALKASDETGFIDIIVKTDFIPKLNIVMKPSTAGFLSGKTYLLMFGLIPMAIYCILLIRRQRAAYGVPIGYFDAMPVLLFLASGLVILSLYVVSAGLVIMRLAVALIMVTEILLVNTLYTRSMLPDRLRHTAVSVGLICIALTMSGQYQAMNLLFIVIFGMYLPVCVGILLIYCKMKSIESMYAYNELLFSALMVLLHIVMMSFFILNFGYDLFSLPILISTAYFIVFCAGVFKNNIQKNKELNSVRSISESDPDYLIQYKPDNLGRLQDLLDIFLKNKSNFSHSRNVSLYTYILCKNSGMNNAQSEMVAQAAFLHDIGKMMLPSRLTASDQNLTGSEYEEMKKHTIYGFNLFADKDSEMMKAAAVIAKEHHERYDGNGYYGIAGDQISVYSQIVSIADVFDATTAERTYKKAWPFEEGFKHICDGSGSLFSQKYVDVFKESKDEIYKIYCDTRR